MSRTEVFGRLARVASTNLGIFDQRQAERCGASAGALRAWARDGVLEQVGRGVYRVTAAPRTADQRILVACTVAGKDALASARTAAALHHFDSFPSLHLKVHVDLLLPRHSTYRNTQLYISRSDSIAPEDRCFVGRIPTTSPIRTLIELGKVAGRDQIEEVLDGAERDGKVNRRALERRLNELRTRGRRGVGPIADILRERAALAHLPRTVLERRMLRLLAAHGLPVPICQYAVTRSDGRTAYLDFAYPDRRLAIEVDGNGSHATPTARSADNERSNQLPAWRFVRFTYEDVTGRGDAVAAAVALHLTS